MTYTSSTVDSNERHLGGLLANICMEGSRTGLFTGIINEYDMIYRVGQKTGLFLRVDNFATVGGRNAGDMSKFCKFYLEKNIKLAYQCVKYSLPNLHKYSMSLR